VKLPRDISGVELVAKLRRLGYEITRQRGSHIRITIILRKKQHHITIPDHNPIKIGTLNNILNELSTIHKISKDELILKLFH